MGVNGVYKPTYNWGPPSCIELYIYICLDMDIEHGFYNYCGCIWIYRKYNYIIILEKIECGTFNKLSLEMQLKNSLQHTQYLLSNIYNIYNVVPPIDKLVFKPQ